MRPRKIPTLNNHTVTLGKVTALDHKVLDNAVEGRALISEALLASSKSTRILSGEFVRMYISDDRIEAYRKFSAVCDGDH